MIIIENSKKFIINSANRISGSDSDFSIALDIVQEDQFDHCVVLRIKIPKSYYLIQSGQNTFTLQEGAQSTTVTIPPGNYNRRSFQTVLKGALDAASVTIGNSWVYTVSYPNTISQADTGKYTITVSGNGGTQPALIFTDYVYEQCGFARNSTNNFSANSLTSTNVLNFQLEDTLFLNSDIVSNESGDAILQDIYCSTSDPNFSNIYHENFDLEMNVRPMNRSFSNTFRFYLTDENTLPISLNGQNIVFTLLCFRMSNLSRQWSRHIDLQDEIIDKKNRAGKYNFRTPPDFHDITEQDSRNYTFDPTVSGTI